MTHHECSQRDRQVLAARVSESRRRRRGSAGLPHHCAVERFGQNAPSKRINVGAIGVGRISRGHDMPGILQYDNARIMAVCDLDAHRVEEGKKFVNDYYAKKTGKPYDGVTGYADYHELLPTRTSTPW